MSAHFVKSVVDLAERKLGKIPEVGFIGRSNVGKSSLINCLTMRKIARTSSVPGATKTINLYKVEYEYKAKRKSVIFSDFPGFGYTALPKRTYEQWERMIDSYVSNNAMIKRMIWVFDTRRSFDELDHLTLEWLKSKEIKFSFAVTKIDKLARNEMHLKKNEFVKLMEGVPVFFVSAKEGTGRKELLGHILDAIN